MSSSSFSSPPPTVTTPKESYDVFISFRGTDTRKSFTSHLYAALRRKLIRSFMDGEHLRAGDEISESIFKAIEGSKLYIIIFSRNYASSRWCLEELLKILEQRKMPGKRVIPVFYKVDPSDVRYQQGKFKDAFSEQEKNEKDKVQSWKAALEEAANLTGWCSEICRPESKLIESIVEDVLKNLNRVSLAQSVGLVGIDSQIRQVNSFSSPPPTVTIPKGGYDVFISFRGTDTLNRFTSHLYAALRRKLIRSFMDGEHLRAGGEISESIFKAIEGSKLYLIIFSRNYAFSKWCLEKLVKILEQRKMLGKRVIPVFYKVDPSHVRNQQGKFEKAFSEHEKNEKKDKVQSWQAALEEAANLTGWGSKICRPESKLTESIVEDVLKNLNPVSLAQSVGLVGIDSQIRQVNSLLWKESVRSIGIWGMGGIGKTTLAKAIFDSINTRFQGFFFLENVREELKRHGAVTLKSKLLSALLEEEGFNLAAPSVGLTIMKERLHLKRVLIVLDDVDGSILPELLPLLGRQHDVFGQGSKIIITSRDKQVLQNLVDSVFEVQGLNDDEALQLFSLNAFKGNDSTFGHLELSRVVNYARGNPLVLKVLGCALFGRSKTYCDSALNKLEKFPKPTIMNILRISYDGLSYEEQNIFLDIACFFRGEDKDRATKMLSDCYHCVDCNIINLIDKSLVTFSVNNKLEVHDLLQEMSRGIVYEESIKNPGKRSRLVEPNDVHYVLTKKKGTEAVESISLDLSQTREMYLDSNAFEGMTRLRYLKFYISNPSTYYKSNVQLPHPGLRCFSDELRSFFWQQYPAKSLPSNFCAENLVQLDLPNSAVEQLWTGVQHLVNLRWIDLSNCKNLLEIPDLSMAKRVESIRLGWCRSLVAIHSSLQSLNNLKELSLEGCENLRSLPSRFDSKFLRILNLRDCSYVQKCPDILGNLEELYLYGTSIKALPQSIDMLKVHKVLSLSNCSNISKFPEISRNIEMLHFSGSTMEEVPSSIEFLTRLDFLDMSDNIMLLTLPSSICKLKSLRFLFLRDCPNLETFPEILEEMEGLEVLDLSNCKNLKKLPDSMCNLTSLSELDLSNCKHLCCIPKLPHSLLSLMANNCESLETLSSHCQSMYFANCFKLDHNKILQDALLRIQSGKLFHLGILLPGNKIPQWMSHRTMGSSGTIPMPSSCNNFIGIAFCIVLGCISSNEEYGSLSFMCKWHAKAINGEYDDFIFERTILYRALLFKSDHVLLQYYYDGYFNDFYPGEVACSKYSESSFEFYSPREDNNVVKKCGIHLFFDEDQVDAHQDLCSDSNEYSFGSNEHPTVDEDFCSNNGEDSWESMIEDANMENNFDNYHFNDAEQSTGTRIANEEEEEPHPKRLRCGEHQPSGPGKGLDGH